MDGRGYAAAYKQLESIAQGFDPSFMSHSSRKQSGSQPQHYSHHLHHDGSAYNSTSASTSGVAAQHHLMLSVTGGYVPTSTAALNNHSNSNSNTETAHATTMALYNGLSSSSSSSSQQQSAAGSSQHKNDNNSSSNNNNNNNYSNNFNLNHHYQHRQPAHSPYSSSSATTNNTTTRNKNTSFFNFDPLPLARNQHSAAVGNHGSSTSSHHVRTSSFDEFLLMNPGILSAGSFDPFPVTISSSSAISNSSSYNNNNTSFAACRVGTQEQQIWLESFQMEVSGLSLDPMSGAEVVHRVRACMDDVLSRYLPCVDFLVQCQQDLRKGLTYANSQHTSSKRSRRYGLTPREFFLSYVHPLPQRFHLKNRYLMESTALSEAMAGLDKLCLDAKNAERHGCEAVKNHFLGGMKDGESWGLRKWLSKNGNALRVCTDVECIVQALRNLDKKKPETKKIADILRPLARQTLDRLKSDVPQSYQEHSSAHPYLPFFHRLESGLKAMSAFDPEDDDVICIDDSDDEDEVQPAVPPPPPTKSAKRQREPPPRTLAESKKRKAEVNATVTIDTTEEDDASVQPNLKAPFQSPILDDVTAALKNDDSSSSGESDDESVIEVVGFKPAGSIDSQASLDDSNTWLCAFCLCKSPMAASNCQKCGESNYLKDFAVDSYTDAEREIFGESSITAANSPDDESTEQQRPTQNANLSCQHSSQDLALQHQGPSWPIPEKHEAQTAAFFMANKLEILAHFFEQSQEDAVRPADAPYGIFWDGDRYASALRLFSSILRSPEAPQFVERMDDDKMIQAGNPPYSHVIKHPLCFRDIAAALFVNVEATETVPSSQDGRLPVRGLSTWNMWKGMDLLQAIDLVFLNSLAYGRAVDGARSQHRAKTNKLRKTFWDGITSIIASFVGRDNDRRRQCTPTRRSESSGFVVYKIQER